MRLSSPADHRQPLLPAGHRWGFGAQSVLPYLTVLHTRATESVQDAHDAIRNPVFRQMDVVLRAMRHRQ